MSTSESSYRTYWLTWAVLLALTLGMLLMGFVSLSKGLLVSLLLAGMLVKASLIGGYFMHLRREKLILVVSVGVSLLATAVLLFWLISYDAVRALELSAS